MNERLWILYTKLNQKEQEALKRAFSEAPTMQRLIAFLAKAKGPFQSPKAVRAIYTEDLEEVDFPQLTNRFYKLRQQLVQWLLRELIGHTEVLAPAMQELVYIRSLFLANRYGLVIPLLERLVADCETDNLFEVLPEALSLWLRSLQSVHPEATESIQDLEERLGTALTLQSDWQQALYQDRLAYRAAQYSKAVQRLKRLAHKHKNYPRFKLLYHFTAFLRGAFQREMAKKNNNAISRHLNNLKDYQAEYPDMPVLYYEPYHKERSRWILYIAEAALLFLQRQYPQAEALLARRAKEMQAQPEVPAQASEAMFTNSSHIYLSAGKIQEAEAQLQELLHFQSQQKLEERMETTYSSLANLYVYAYPQLPCKQYQSLDAILNEYVAQFEAVKDELRAAGNQAIRVNLAVIMGEYEKAWDLWQKQAGILEMFRYYGITKDPSCFYEALAKGDQPALEAQKPHWQESLEESTNPGAQQFYAWILRVMQHYPSV